LVPSVAWFDWQFPDPSQVSGLSHCPLDGSPHAVPDGLKPSGGHAPEVPVQLSATSHGPVDARHIVVDGLKPSTQWPAPSQESVPSHAPPFEVPVQVVVLGWKPSGGHAPEVPVQLSATSH